MNNRDAIHLTTALMAGWTFDAASSLELLASEVRGDYERARDTVPVATMPTVPSPRPVGFGVLTLAPIVIVSAEPVAA